MSKKRELFICMITPEHLETARKDMIADSGGEIDPSDENVLNYLQDLINTQREQFYDAMEAALRTEPIIFVDTCGLRSYYRNDVLSRVNAENSCLVVETLDDLRDMLASEEFDYISDGTPTGEHRVNFLITKNKRYTPYRPITLRSAISSTLIPFKLEKYL